MLTLLVPAMRTSLVKWSFLTFIVALSGCAVRSLAPAKPSLAAPAAPASSSAITLRYFTVGGLGPRDDEERVALLRARLADYLAARPELWIPAEGPRFFLDVHIELVQTTHRTWVLDVVTAPWAGVFAPWWGEVEGEIEVVLTAPDGEIEVYRHTATRDFSALFFTWFRRGYVERAYTETYRELFEAVLEELVAKDSLVAKALPSAPRAAPARVVPPPEEECRSLRERPRPPAGKLATVLRAIGGVEVNAFVGQARVESQVEDETGALVPLAAGEAHQRGFGLAIYGAAKTTGFYLTPALGFVSQRISIADFRRTLPEASTDGGVEIMAVCSDPTTTTHAAVDCAAPNTYALELQSGYGGVGAGYDLVLGTSRFAWVNSAIIAINAIEYRHISADIGSHHAARARFAFLQSGSFGAASALEWPRAHLGLRLGLDYQWYREFRFAEPLQFEGEVIYNDAKGVFERPLRKVTAAKLTTWTLKCALVGIF